MKRNLTTYSLALLLVFMAGSNALTLIAQSTPETVRESYLTPSQDILDEVLSPRHKNIISLSNLDPTRNYFLNYTFNEDKSMASIEGYAKDWYNLGGLQIDPLANRDRKFTTQMPGRSEVVTADGIELINAKDGKKQRINTPSKATVSGAKWSPDGSRIAYFAHFNDGTHIYVANSKNGKTERITKQAVLATLNEDISWSGDGKYIFTVLVPEKRGSEPQKPNVAQPQVRMTTSDKNQLRTYKTLLDGKYEADLLEYYITGQFAKIHVDKKHAHTIGKPALIRSVDAAPSGEYFVVQTLQKPFSYVAPVSAFGWTEEIWDVNGDTLTTLRKSEARLGVPDHDVLEDFGRSNISWRPDGEGLSFITKPVEDKKDKDSTEVETPTKDKLHKVNQWLPPFDESSLKTIYSTKSRIASVSYAENIDVFFVDERPSGKKQNLKAIYADTSYTIYSYNTDDFYENPGNLMRKMGANGLEVVQLSSDEGSIFLSGVKYDESPVEQSPRPFIDKVDIKTGEKARVFESAANFYEQVSATLDDDVNNIVISRESAQVHPDSWYINLENDRRTKLTKNKDYNEAISKAKRERFKVKRADGFEFWVEAIVSQDWDSTPLPGLIWHYPTEYNDQEAYDKSQRTYNKNTFPIIQSWAQRAPEVLIKRGYAIIRSDWPISYNSNNDPNNGFIWSIQQNATVVIDSLASKGYVDRNRMAIGGHSYGAFGTAHAMIHTSFFKAGIAGDSNFNRTLTPLGFQRERNSIWTGLDRYLQMSPIFWADRLEGALLMYHGADDQNTGTWPDNSWRMFHALNALGKPAALYMYPYADHHTGAKEINLDNWTRWSQWLDHYLKGKGKAIPEIDLGK